MAPTLVGRADDLARLRGLRGSASAGRGGSAVVVGDAGLGKTALVGALTADSGGLTVAQGACSPGAASHLPYAPWIEILSALDRAVPSAAVPDGVRRAVAPLLLPWDAGPSGGGVLFAGATEFVVLAAAVRPVLLVVEDVHWADAASLGLLAHIARRASRAPIAVVATLRPFASAAPADLTELIRAADVHLSLTPLPDDDIALILDGMPDVPGGADRDRIIRLAEGSPFLALHLATVAPDNDDVLGVRRALHDPEANRLLIRLALAGDVPDDVLAVSAGLPLDRRVELCRGLVDDGLLTVRDGRLQFRHALIREEVLALATPAETVAAHGDLADAMTSGAGDENAAALAHHHFAAHRWSDGLRSSVRAADHADRVRAYGAAHDALAAARSAWSRVEEPSLVTGLSYADLLLRVGRTARAHGDFAAAHDAWNELATTGHDPATVAYERAATWYFAGDEIAAVQEFERAAQLLDATSEVSRGEVLVALARALLTRHSLQRALEVALAAMAATDDPDLRLNARISAATARWLDGGAGDPIADELRSCAREAEARGAVDLLLRALGNLLNVEFGRCRFGEMLAIVDDVTRVCARFGPVPTLTSVVSLFQVEALRALGRSDEALAVVERAIDDAGFRGVASGLHILAATIAADRGEWTEVSARIERAQAGWIDDDVIATMRVDLRCRLALHAGDPAGALALLRAALADWSADAHPIAALRLYRIGWRTIAEAEGPGDDDLTARLDDLAAAAPVDEPRGELVRALGRAERARVAHDADEAVRWATIAETLRGVGWRGELPEALLRQAQALARGRQVAEAGRVAHEARAVAEAIGALVVRDEADRLLALLGHPSAPPVHARPERPMGLTPRELQVLELLTHGASNREIGRTLFISERTAGVHISNIMAKLGVSNRTQAAQIGTRLASLD